MQGLLVHTFNMHIWLLLTRHVDATRLFVLLGLVGPACMYAACCELEMTCVTAVGELPFCYVSAGCYQHRFLYCDLE